MAFDPLKLCISLVCSSAQSAMAMTYAKLGLVLMLLMHILNGLILDVKFVWGSVPYGC